MCPISGLVQLLIVVVTFLSFCQFALIKAQKISFSKKNITLTMYAVQQVDFNITNLDPATANQYQIYTENEDIASIEDDYFIKIDSQETFRGSFNITGNFLGKTSIKCRTKERQIDGNLDVIVVRKKRVIDTVFTASVATLVSIIYINFGCALNWSELRDSIKKPIGPSIGFVGQFIVMPILSFVLGKVLFPDSPEMQLGMFFTGVSPAGGASNVWTAVLEGNINLSITMTTISTFAAFAMMPLWLFTLGKVIFDHGNILVPYKEISTYAVALVVPLAIGYLIQRYLKGVAQFLARILKGFSSLLILFIIIFAIVTNLYLFKLFSWQIVLAGMGLPYIGYLSAYLLAKLLRQPDPDCLAIAIETGIQNTGIAIFLLRFALPQPEADLTTVAPVAVAIMTPFPLMFIYIYKKIYARIRNGKHQKLKLTAKEPEKLILDSNFNTNNSEGGTTPISSIMVPS